MKKHLLVLVISLGGLISNILAQPIINIPDPLFKDVLIYDNSINTNMDTEIDSAEAASYTGGISIVEVGVSDLTGIEAFVNITSLYASDNYLTNVDLSYNNQLTQIYIQHNLLTSFTAGNNPNLSTLDLGYNQLTALNTTNFSGLMYLTAQYNQLTSLDISTNYSLFELYLDSNELTSLDVSPNYNLYWLECRSNNITDLHVTTNYYLGNLSCGSNPFTCLNLSGNTNLTNFECIDATSLQKLNLKNGTNTGLSVAVINCPLLSCVQVDDSTYSATNWTNFNLGWSSYFSNDCGQPVASFTHDGPVCSGTPINFDQTMSNVDYFQWNFGDGNTSTSTDPSHLFTSGGYYYVELYAKNCYGQTYPFAEIELGNDIFGELFYPGGDLTAGEVYLLKYESFYTSFDTVGYMYLEGMNNYYFPDIFDGQYIIKVFPDTANNPELIPTYSGNQATWETSFIINHGCFSEDSLDIMMLELPTALSGPGSLSGEIIEGAGFGRAPGDPIHGVDVKLGVTASNIIATTSTDTLGQYEFTDIPYGTYTIYVDIPGLLKDSSYTLTVDSSTLHWTYLDYIVDSSKVYIIGNVSVEGIESDEPTSFTVYPNPVKDNAFIKYSVGKNAEVSFDIYNSVGVKLNTIYNNYTEEGEYLLPFNPKTLGLRSGVYFITCTMNNKTYTQKIVILE